MTWRWTKGHGSSNIGVPRFTFELFLPRKDHVTKSFELSDYLRVIYLKMIALYFCLFMPPLDEYFLMSPKVTILSYHISHEQQTKRALNFLYPVYSNCPSTFGVITSIKHLARKLGELAYEGTFIRFGWL